ncbi:type VI immunity family protein [Serratia liquefaciens]|uniref:type VI immunity family protein n=1 Tax=Serratia liquefaciens TaxID=614 RepID=UPI0004AC149F|nr:type VI immunity family protein [Serratia liquefaciens]GAK29720.1 hypothetical protein SLIQ_23835 [Serratia liquefaciens FK01]
MNIWTQYQKYRSDLIYTSDDGRLIKVCVGLSGTFYFWHGETRETRLAIARCFERFQELFGQNLTWVVPNKDADLPGIKINMENNISSMHEYIETMDADGLLDWRVSGGQSWEEASDCFIAASTARQWQKKARNVLSHLSFAMPIEAVYGPTGEAQCFTNFIRFCCEQLRPWSGIAGLTSLLPLGGDSVQVGEFDLQQRYFGLDTVSGTPFLRNFLQTHLKGANWLTMFDQEFPVTMTREEWNTLDNTPGIQVWQAGRTYVLQAGEQPVLGPVPDGVPPLYKIVSDLIKPMRLTPMRSFHTGSMTGEVQFNRDTSELWSQRFDAPGIWPLHPDKIMFNDVDSSIDEYAALPARAPGPHLHAASHRPTALRAQPGETCPHDGEWFSPLVQEKIHVKQGEPMPCPETTAYGVVTWYLRID